MIYILKRIGATIEDKGETLLLTAPFERVDLNIVEDYIEEIGRIHGYHHVVSVIPDAVPGTTYTIYGKPYLYKGSDKIHEQSIVLMRDHPELFDAATAYAMIKDPLGHKKPPCRLDQKIVAALATAKTLGKILSTC